MLCIIETSYDPNYFSGVIISTTFVRISPALQLNSSTLAYLGLKLEPTACLERTAHCVLED